MKVTVEHLPQHQVVLNIEADPEEFESSMREAYRRLVQRANVPGFRKGKAPMAMVERYTGKAAFLEEAMYHLLPEVTRKAIEQEGIEAGGQPRVELVTTEPVAWKATVDLAPKVDLGGYRELRMALEPVEVGQEEVERALEELRFSQAPWEPVEHPAQMGDLLTLDITVEEDGRRVADDKGVQYRLADGLPEPAPGFAQQLIGLASGHEEEFHLSFPDSDERQEHAGKEYRFQVRVIDIKAKTLPDLDDEFAKGVGGGYDTLEALREYVVAQLRGSAERRARDALQERALQAVIDSAVAEYSPALVEHEAEHALQEQEERLNQNQVALDAYLGTIGKSREELLEELKLAAQERVLRSLVLTELKDREQIQVTEVEIGEELQGLVAGAGQMGGRVQSLYQSEAGRRSLERSLLTRKTLERLVEIVTEQATGPSPEPALAAKEEASNP